MPLTIKKKATNKPKKVTAVQPKKVAAQLNKDQAYQLVTNDLLQALQKAQPGEKIPLGNLGFFKKGLCEVNPGDGYVYTCHKLSFKMSKQLKEVLNG